MESETYKISIIGGSGTGKTTLANNLGRILNIPVYHLDGFNYLDNWVLRDEEERDKIILETLKKNKWIMDGTYTSTLKERLENSDLIIYLDYSTFAQVKGVLARFFKNKGKEKEEIPGCKENLTWSFFWWVVIWRHKMRKKIMSLVKNVDNNKVLIFKKRKDLEKWYQKEFQNKILIKEKK